MSKIINPYRFAAAGGGTNPGTDNLISAWEFEETGANVAYDEHGTNNGSISGASVNQPSVSRGYTLTSTDIIDTNLNTNYTTFSFSGWVYSNGYTTSNRVVSKEDGATGMAAYLNAGAEILFLAYFSTQFGRWKVSCPYNQWNHIVITYDSSSDTNTPDIYINGVKPTMTTDQSPSGSYLTTTTDYLFGNTVTGNRSINGTLDQFVIWDKILSQGEVTELYNQGSGLKYTKWDAGLKTDLISVWELDETSGTNVVDSHGSNDGTNTGASVDQQGIVSNLGRCFSFVGSSNDNVLTGSNIGISGSQSRSLSIWVNVDDLTTSTLMDFGDHNTAYAGYKLRINNSTTVLLDTGLAVTADRTWTVAISTGTWYHFVLVQNGTDISDTSLYINNSLQTVNTTNDATLNTTNTVMRIASEYNPAVGDSTDGRLDQPAIWSKALSTQEISNLYNSGKGLAYADWGSTLKTDLVSVWEFDERDTTLLAFDSHSTNDGTILGPTVNQTGKVGKCYSYDGVNDRVTVGNYNISNSFSISVWFYRDVAQNDYLYSKWDSGLADRSISVSILNNNLRVVISDDGTYSSGTVKDYRGDTTLSTLSWVHGVVTYDGTNLKLYINGSEETPTKFYDATITDIHTSTVQNATGCYFNNSSSAGEFDGNIDQVMLFNEALTQDNVTWLYNNGNGRAYSEL